VDEFRENLAAIIFQVLATFPTMTFDQCMNLQAGQLGVYYKNACRIEEERAVRLGAKIAEIVAAMFAPPKEPEPVSGADTLRQAFGGL